MNTYAIDKQFGSGWYDRKNNDGVVLISDGVLTTEGRTGSAFREVLIPVQAGQTLKVEVWAKKIEGDGRISIDLNREVFTNHLIDYVAITKREWAKYTLEVQVPYDHPDKQYVRVSFGKWESVPDKTETQFKDPVIYVSGGYGVRHVLADGQIMCSSSQLALNENMVSCGVKKLEWEDVPGRIKVTLNTKADARKQPLVQVSTTTGQHIFATAGGMEKTGDLAFYIRLSDGTTFLNRSQLSELVYIHFEVKM